MTAFSDYLESKVLGVTLLGSAYAAPSTIFMALSTSCTTDGAVFTEVVAGTAYARQVVVFGTPADDGTKRKVANSVAINFTEATTSWGGITHAGLYDSPTSGNQLYWGALTATKTISTGDTFHYEIGAFSVSLD